MTWEHFVTIASAFFFFLWQALDVRLFIPGALCVYFALLKLKPWATLTLFRVMIKQGYDNAGTCCGPAFAGGAGDDVP